MSRLSRQLLLPGFGPEGQQKLASARVLVVGAGGLGCPALLYLAAAGVGVLGIIDGDTVSLSNLNRQVLYGVSSLGELKAEAAARQLAAQFPDVGLEVHPFFLQQDNALALISGYDLVLDGSDNFATRYLVNDACYLLKKPLVLGAVYQHEGQVAVLHVGPAAAGYRDLYPVPPAVHEVPNCSATGVLGVLPGIIGLMQAAEVIKLLSGLGSPLVNKVLFYQLLTASVYEIAITPHPDSRKMQPRDAAQFMQMEYEAVCAAKAVISWAQAMARFAEAPAQTVFVDIRESDEQPRWHNNHCLDIPMSQWTSRIDELNAYSHIMLFCQSGVRSRHLAGVWQQRMAEKHIFTIEGGILAADATINKVIHHG